MENALFITNEDGDHLTVSFVAFCTSDKQGIYKH